MAATGRHEPIVIELADEPIALKWAGAFSRLIDEMQMDVEDIYYLGKDPTYNPHIPYAVVRKLVDEQLRYLEEAWD